MEAVGNAKDLAGCKIDIYLHMGRTSKISSLNKNDRTHIVFQGRG